jgi:hypothetical protein
MSGSMVIKSITPRTIADAHGDLEGHDVEAQLLPEIAADAVRIGPRPVHLVDERVRGHAGSFHLADRTVNDWLLDASDRAQILTAPSRTRSDRSNLDGEVDVAGGVDQIDALAVPLHWVAAEVIVMPPLRSNSMKSMVAPPLPLPSRTSCMRWIRPQ